MRLAKEEFGFVPSGDLAKDQKLLQEILESERLREIIVERPPRDGSRTALAKIMHMRKKDKSIEAHPAEEDISDFIHCHKYLLMLTAPFDIGNGCCNVMKKNPMKKYEKETGRVGITGQMADESQLRANWWMKYGCNSFDKKRPISNPMSLWLEQDVLLYIKLNNLPICEIYGDIVSADGRELNLENTNEIMNLWGGFSNKRPILKTTGLDRCGCIFCGYSAHREKLGEGRFEKLKETHPNQYNYIMKPVSEGGMGFKDVIDWINEHINIRINY